jgi:predicted DNA-binding helix-hairpin-helix protein
MANAYMSLHNAGIVKGLFLSSGIAGGGVCTQDKLIATAEILRKKHKYRGYIHLKLMPGAEYSQVERSMQLANRVSSNLEAPNIQRLEQLAPRKDFSVELLKPLQWVDEIRRYKTLEQDGREKRWPSMTTQFVVGPAGETDYELLKTSEYLYKDLNLSRIYYMSFRPVVNTPLEQYPPTPPYRENHLYQASFLLRDYRFKIEELPFDQSGGLPKKTDPKTAWAESNLAGSRIEINHANRQVLLRIPGIGPRSVKAIISGRKINRIKVIEDLKKIGINPTRALPYILLDGKKPPQQLPLFC